MPVSDVGIVGTGTMGGLIAELLVVNGVRAVLVDQDPAKSRALAERLNARFDVDLAEHSFDFGGLARCQLVIEAAPERLETKQELMRSIEDHAPQNAVLATNTSGFPIAQVALNVHGKDRVIGMHFFKAWPGDHLNTLVELVTMAETRGAVIEAAGDLLDRLGCTTVFVRDNSNKYGHVANRIWFAAALEARRILEEGIATREDINTAMEIGFGWPLGPLPDPPVTL